MASWVGSYLGWRWIVVAALGVWIAISAAMLVVWGAELDLDAVFPGFEKPGGEVVTRLPVPTPPNPPAAVVYAFAAVGVVVALPLAFPARPFRAALLVSTVVVGIALAATILRLGILLTPVLALQVWALSRLHKGRELSGGHS